MIGMQDAFNQGNMEDTRGMQVVSPRGIFDGRVGIYADNAEIRNARAT
jgi:hypothetical protein